MLSSTVPGNRNLDDVDVGLQKFDNLLQTNRTLKLQKYFEAVSVTSLGSGKQVVKSSSCTQTAYWPL